MVTAQVTALDGTVTTEAVRWTYEVSAAFIGSADAGWERVVIGPKDWRQGRTLSTSKSLATDERHAPSA